MKSYDNKTYGIIAARSGNHPIFCDRTTKYPISTNKLNPLKITTPHSPQLRTSNRSNYYHHTRDITMDSLTLELKKIEIEKKIIKENHINTENYRKKMLMAEKLNMKTNRNNENINSSNINGSLNQTTRSIKPVTKPKPFNLSSDHRAMIGNKYHPPPAPASIAVHNDDIHSNKNKINKEHSHVTIKKNQLEPHPPKLMTSLRAKNNPKPPVKIIDKDEEELKKKFHARPIDPRIYNKSTNFVRNIEPKPLTKPVAPVLSTQRRTRPIHPSTMSSSHNSISSYTHISPKNSSNDKEQTTNTRNIHKIEKKKEITIPETPKFRSLERHNAYKDMFNKKIEEEKAKEIEKTKFKAQPIPYSTKIPLSKILHRTYENNNYNNHHLTVPEPFSLPGEKFHLKAMEKKKQIIQKEKNKITKEKNVKARPMPDFSNEDYCFKVHYSNNNTTIGKSPMLRSKIQAEKRNKYDEANHERINYEKYLEEKKKQFLKEQELKEIKELRKNKLVFHARKLPEKIYRCLDESTITNNIDMDYNTLKKHYHLNDKSLKNHRLYAMAS